MKQDTYQSLLYFYHINFENCNTICAHQKINDVTIANHILQCQTQSIDTIYEYFVYVYIIIDE